MIVTSLSPVQCAKSCAGYSRRHGFADGWWHRDAARSLRWAQGWHLIDWWFLLLLSYLISSYDYLGLEGRMTRGPFSLVLREHVLRAAIVVDRHVRLVPCLGSLGSSTCWSIASSWTRRLWFHEFVRLHVPLSTWHPNSRCRKQNSCQERVERRERKGRKRYVKRSATPCEASDGRCGAEWLNGSTEDKSDWEESRDFLCAHQIWLLISLIVRREAWVDPEPAHDMPILFVLVVEITKRHPQARSRRHLLQRRSVPSSSLILHSSFIIPHTIQLLISPTGRRVAWKVESQSHAVACCGQCSAEAPALGPSSGSSLCSTTLSMIDSRHKGRTGVKVSTFKTWLREQAVGGRSAFCGGGDAGYCPPSRWVLLHNPCWYPSLSATGPIKHQAPEVSITAGCAIPKHGATR